MSETFQHDKPPAQSLFTTTLSAQPSCIDFSKSLPRIFVIGTYQLDDPPTSTQDAAAPEETPSPAQSRSGTLQLFRLEDDDTMYSPPPPTFPTQLTHPGTPLQTLPLPSAVLSAHFSLSRPDILAATTSTGSISLFRLSPPTSSSPSPYLVPGKSFQAFPTTTLVLSLAWNPSSNPKLRNEAAVSLSDGSIATLDLGLSFQVKGRRRAHAEEGWCVEWSRGKEINSSSTDGVDPDGSWSPEAGERVGTGAKEGKLTVGAGHFLFSGGDDALVRAFDVECESLSPSTPPSPSPSPFFSPHTPRPHSSASTPSNPSPAIDLPLATASHSQPQEEDAFAFDVGSVLAQTPSSLATTGMAAGAFVLPAPTAMARWDRMTHGAGVTALLPLVTGEEECQEMVATGSYDEYLRVLAPGVEKRWKLLAEERVGGGVWKVELLGVREDGGGKGGGGGEGEGERKGKRKRYLVLASVMHGGVRVVEVVRRGSGGDGEEGVGKENGEWKMEVLERFEGHGSMCYGAAAVAVGGEERGEEGGEWKVVSTSFYDRLVCVWGFSWR
ncbi:hypothetical protein MMC10_008211 [Thelotrema lepadinum]|nr:hypothetical protein [Thelotrema lepadinum]